MGQFLGPTMHLLFHQSIAGVNALLSQALEYVRCQHISSVVMQPKAALNLVDITRFFGFGMIGRIALLDRW